MKKGLMTFVVAVAVGALGVAARPGGAAAPASAVARCDGGRTARSDMHALAVGAGFAGADGTRSADEPGRDRGGRSAGPRPWRRSTRLIASGRRHGVRSRPEGAATWWSRSPAAACGASPTRRRGARSRRCRRRATSFGPSGPGCGWFRRRRAEPSSDRRADPRSDDVLARVRIRDAPSSSPLRRRRRQRFRRTSTSATSGATTSARLDGCRSTHFRGGRRPVVDRPHAVPRTRRVDPVRARERPGVGRSRAAVSSSGGSAGTIARQAADRFRARCTSRGFDGSARLWNLREGATGAWLIRRERADGELGRCRLRCRHGRSARPRGSRRPVGRPEARRSAEPSLTSSAQAGDAILVGDFSSVAAAE